MTEVGQTLLRKEVVDRVVKGFSERSYKFKQAVSIVPTSAWANVFWREDSSPLTDKTGNATKGIPRGANFPSSDVDWTRFTSNLEKYGHEANIFWEDVKSDEIDVQSRTLFRISERVTKSVDDEIYNSLAGLNDTGHASGAIQTVAIAALSEWTSVASAAIIDDLMHASQLIAVENYSTQNLICFISPRDKRSIMNYLATKGAQFPSVGERIATNGFVQRVAGIDLVESNSVPASEALILVPKICGTWKTLQALTTDVTPDPFRSVRIRAVEVGITQVTDPKAIVRITNTQRTSEV